MSPHTLLSREAGLASAGLFSGSAKLARAAHAVSIAGLCTQLHREQAPGGSPSIAGNGDAQRRPCTHRGRVAHAVWAAEPRRYRRARRLRQHQGLGSLAGLFASCCTRGGFPLLQRHVQTLVSQAHDDAIDDNIASTCNFIQGSRGLAVTATFYIIACRCLHHVIGISAAVGRAHPNQLPGQVVARIRPLSEREAAQGDAAVVQVSADNPNCVLARALGSCGCGAS